MARPPTTAVEFVAILKKSNLVKPDRLEAIVKGWQETNQQPEDANKFATKLIQEGVITTFHATNLLKGRYKGFVLGKYRVLQPLGSGGMGTVYLCEHMTIGHRVAIKVLPGKENTDPVSIERFFREARAAAQLNHPNIVRAHDIDRSENYFYLIMDYVEGVGLNDLVQQLGPLDPIRAAHYIAQAAVGLQYIHEMGLIHRDVKPGNLLLDRMGTIRILDLGLARIQGDDTAKITEKFDNKTILGTADYIAPEQAIESFSVDRRCDIYSLGATFYFLLAGRAPFQGVSAIRKLLHHQTQDPPPILQFSPRVPKEMVEIVDKMMRKDREKRVQHAIEVADALQPWTDIPIPIPTEEELPGPSSSGPQTPTPRSTTSSADYRSAVRGMPGSNSTNLPKNQSPSGSTKQPTVIQPLPSSNIPALPPKLSEQKTVPSKPSNKKLLLTIGLGIVVGIILLLVFLNPFGGR
jgi:eukaryotic-like serine/threonine-protein kinase